MVTRAALVASALESAALAEQLGLSPHQIVLSCKVSGVQDLILVYRDLARRCRYPLHLGLTEAGMGSKGIVASSAPMGILLQEGIGDTIRVSLTPEPGGDRSREVVVAQELLQTMGCVPSIPWSPHVRVVGVPPVPISRNWPVASRTGYASRCRNGVIVTRGWSICTWR